MKNITKWSNANKLQLKYTSSDNCSPWDSVKTSDFKMYSCYQLQDLLLNI